MEDIQQISNGFCVPIINKTNLNNLMNKYVISNNETQGLFKTLFQGFIRHIPYVKEDLLKNAKVVVLDSHQTTVTVQSGDGQNEFHVVMNQKGDVEILSPDPSPNNRVQPFPERLKDTFDNSMTEVINKTKLGKVLVQICGNEGSEDSPVQANFRKLLQATIDYLEKETDTVWTNAEITHYDSYGNTVVVAAGDARYKFIVQVDGKDQIQITPTQRPGVFWRSIRFFNEAYKSMPKRAIKGSEGNSSQ